MNIVARGIHHYIPDLDSCVRSSGVWRAGEYVQWTVARCFDRRWDDVQRYVLAFRAAVRVCWIVINEYAEDSMYIYIRVAAEYFVSISAVVRLYHAENEIGVACIHHGSGGGVLSFWVSQHQCEKKRRRHAYYACTPPSSPDNTVRAPCMSALIRLWKRRRSLSHRTERLRRRRAREGRAMSRACHITRTTMSAEYPVHFAAQQGSYKLLELPPDLYKLVESGAETQYVVMSGMFRVD
jgi:hypothetical protein